MASIGPIPDRPSPTGDDGAGGAAGANGGAPTGASPGLASVLEARAAGDGVAWDREGQGRRVVVLRLGARAYAMDLMMVREIIPYRRPTRLPGAPSAVAGLINVRGTVVTVLDLGARLGGAPSTDPAGSIVLAEHGVKTVGLAVDEVLDVSWLADEDVDAPLDANPDRSGTDALVTGIGRIGERVVVVLDVRTLIRQALA